MLFTQLVDPPSRTHSQRRSVNSRLQTTAVELNAAWRASGTPPFQRRRDRPQSDSSADTAVTDSASTTRPIKVYSTWHIQQSPVETRHSRAASGGQSTSPSYVSPPSGDQQSSHDAVDSLLKSLTVRGTGQHICPYGMSCTKGGLRDGKPVIFERNSAFRLDSLRNRRGETHLPLNHDTDRCTQGAFAET
jgi:hypothetical protein